MKKILFICSTVLSLFLAQGVFAADNFKIDQKNSVINWVGSKIGEDHKGTIMIKNGNLEMSEGKLIKGSLTIDMNSIANTDIENEKFKKKLEGHLKAADFFDVSKYAQSKFVFTEVKELGNDQYSVTGDMTIKGVTNKETVQVKINNQNGTVLSGVANFDIDRTKYGIVYKAEKASKDMFFVKWFKGTTDKIIKNNINLNVSLKAAKAN